MSKVYVLMNEQRIVKVFAREADAIAEMYKKAGDKLVDGTDTYVYYVDDRGDTLCMYIEEVEFVGEPVRKRCREELEYGRTEEEEEEYE